MFRSDALEPGKIYAALVESLFAAGVPLAIMAATFFGVGLFVVVVSGDGLAASAVAVGLVATGGKAWLHVRYRREARGTALTPADAEVWERWFAIGNLAFAAALGTLAARCFVLSESGPPLLATGMLFGFCSGQVARIAVRARLCSFSICVAALPSAITAAALGDPVHLGLAAMFALFALGSLESVRYAYSQTRQRIATNHELASVATADPLTGLANRLGLRHAVQERFGSGAAELIGVHCLDLDGFKALNDRYGHATGDAMLAATAERLAGCLRDGDVAARSGGDEFVLLQTGIAHADEAELFARRVCRAVTEPHMVGRHTLSLGMSIGTCTGSTGSDDFDDLLAVADRRMYAVKHAGGGVHAAAFPG